MKKLLSVFAAALCVALMSLLVACNGGSGAVPPIEGDDDRPTYDGTKTLVVYFSQPDNVDDSTVVIDGETLGNTQYMAYVIQENTGANIFRILPEKPYPTNHGELVELARNEQRDNARPKIKGEIADFANYDTVFVGYPNWWSDMPMIMYTFFDTYDFAGKTIIPFNTHGGSGFSSTISAIRGLEPNAEVKDGKSISRNSIQNAEREIIDWVVSLGFEKPQASVTQPTASLTFDFPRDRNGEVTDTSFYIVTGMTGKETALVIPAEHEGIPVTTVGESAFAYSRHNEDILSVTIPDSVTTVERNAFYNRDETTTVNISQNSRLVTIGNNAFSGNRSLTGIYIPSSVESIGDGAFNNDGAVEFTVAQDNTVYRSENGHLIERATDTLIRGGRNGEVPDGVTAIAQAAFRNSSAITELVIPASVTAIGNYFIANSSIASVRFNGTEEQWNEIEKNADMWNYGNRQVELKFKTEPNILIAYFTAESGNTERLADYIHGRIGGDVVKIEAARPYTSQELDYGIKNNRPEVEKAENARPEIAQSTYDKIEISKYDAVFIGYPIWWWTAPMIVGTFLERYDLTGVDVYPFSQSASMNTTHFTTSMEFVRECAAKKGTPTVHDGLFARATSTTAINAYLTANGFNGQ